MLLRIIADLTIPRTPAPLGNTNANGDGLVNFDDINSVITNWLTMCP